MKSILSLFRRARLGRDLAQELEAHLEEKVDDLVEGGLPEAEAREQAKREFGNPIIYREISREVWGWVWLETLLQDLRYGVRTLRNSPGFTAAATVTLALGIAINSTIFSLISGWLLKKPAVEDPDRVVAVVSTNAKRALERGRIAPADFLAWRRANQAFTSLAAFDPEHTFSLTGDRDPERAPGMRVTADYFQVLGVPAVLGRTFVAGEDKPGRDHVALLSYGLWQARFGSDPNIVGKPVMLDGEKYIAIGVMPASFRQIGFLSRLWTPLVLANDAPAPKARDRRSLLVVGRLKTGVGLEQSRAEMTALAQRAEQSDPASERGWGTNVMTLQEYEIQEDHVRGGLRLLMAAVLLVLVIACANVANLLLARAGKRQQEIAVRTALGAARTRIIRQLLVESLLIALVGGSMGLIAANWGIQILRKAVSYNEYLVAMSGDVTLDGRVLAFTCLVSLGAALAFGLAPAIRLSTADPQHTLRQGGRGGDLRRGWGRNVLVGAQIALAVVLVTGAGLIIKAMDEDIGGDYGWNPRRVLTTAVSLTSPRYHDPAQQIGFFQAVAERLQGMPGVEAAGIANSAPFIAERPTFSIREQAAVPATEQPRARYFAMSPGQFEVLNLRLVQGRALTDRDNAAAPRVAIVNRVFANRFFPGKSALGHYIRVDHGTSDWSEIVGIAGNLKLGYGPREEDAQIYESYLQVRPDPEMYIVVRSAGDTNSAARSLRSAVRAVDPDQPIGPVETISSIIDQQEGGDYVFSTLLAIFGALALLLAGIGIYGVVAYAVAQRTHEIGIRIALGARRADVLRPLIGRGMLLALGSAAIGFAAAAPLPSLFASMLEGYRVHSLGIFASVPVVLLAVVLAAIYVPASRAARIDPTEALRYE
jgi:putative ABC transport system permease protein